MNNKVLFKADKMMFHRKYYFCSGFDGQKNWKIKHIVVARNQI